MLRDGPRIEEISLEEAQRLENANNQLAEGDFVMVISPSSDQAIVQPRYFRFSEVLVAASEAFTAGGIIGGLAGEIFSAKLAQAASDAVREKFNELGKDFTVDILNETGLNYVPGAELAAENMVADLAHQMGEETYKRVREEAAKKGAMLGSALAAGIVIVGMELYDLSRYAYHGYQLHRQRQSLQGPSSSNQQAIEDHSAFEEAPLIGIEDDNGQVVDNDWTLMAP